MIVKRMLRKLKHFILMALSLSLPVHATEFDEMYNSGAVVSTEVFVTDKDGSQVTLRSLFTETKSDINVIFIFGGGDMGFGTPGKLWCSDSFEDTQILRILHDKYKKLGVNFIAVASTPIYHTELLSHKKGIFLNGANGSAEFEQANQAFVNSTLASYDLGVLPIEPFFDTRFRLKFNRSVALQPGEGYGEVFKWQGVFRDPDSGSHYGVPSFWIVNNEGKVLTDPFRGNTYHPHEGEALTIEYTFGDIDKVLEALL